MPGVVFVSNINLSGFVVAAGLISGSYSFNTFANGFFNASGSGNFTGQVAGNTLTINFLGQILVGETCSISGSLSGTR